MLPIFVDGAVRYTLLVDNHNVDNLLLFNFRSSGGVVVKLLDCGARGPRLDSWSRRYDFRDWLSPASQLRYG